MTQNKFGQSCQFCKWWNYPRSLFEEIRLSGLKSKFRNCAHHSGVTLKKGLYEEIHHWRSPNSICDEFEERDDKVEQ